MLRNSHHDLASFRGGTRTLSAHAAGDLPVDAVAGVRQQAVPRVLEPRGQLERRSLRHPGDAHAAEVAHVLAEVLGQVEEEEQRRFDAATQRRVETRRQPLCLAESPSEVIDRQLPWSGTVLVVGLAQKSALPRVQSDASRMGRKCADMSLRAKMRPFMAIISTAARYRERRAGPRT